MKKLVATLFILSSISINTYAADLSNWATESYNNMSSYGILNTDVVKENMGGYITREEFCSLVMNIYKCNKRVILTDEDVSVFADTDSTPILEAYKVGIVSGKGNGMFEPKSPITRQEMAVMLSRTLNLISFDFNKYSGQITNYKSSFIDSLQTADWAISDMAAICDYRIITGNDQGQAQPLENATREQAICMLDRVYTKFVTNSTLYTLPKIKSLSKSDALLGKIKASWQPVPDAKEYYIIVKASNSVPVTFTIPAGVTSIDDVISQNQIEECTVILGVLKSYGTQVFSKPINMTSKVLEEPKTEEIKEATPPKVELEEPIIEDPTKKEDSIERENDEQITYDETLIHSTLKSALPEKEKRLFENGFYFETKEIAQENMIEVEIPVWKLNSNGEKVSGISYVEVHKELAGDVVNIFTEIYNDPSQFPIKNIGGFSWRNTASGKVSQHSYGTCIDINYMENYYVQPDGTPITGTHWLPGEDPYSIPADSIVVKTFAKYGWLWGGTAWGDSYAKDYMHFTYLGK